MWQSHPSAIRKSSQKSGDLDWNPIANTIGNIESIIGQGSPVATRGTKYSSRRFWLIARETPASVLATCQNPEAWKITQLRFIGNTLISANFVRFCQSAPLTRSTMKISSNERVIKEPFVPDWTIEWSSVAVSEIFSVFRDKSLFGFCIFRSIISILDRVDERRRGMKERGLMRFTVVLSVRRLWLIKVVRFKVSYLRLRCKLCRVSERDEFII